MLISFVDVDAREEDDDAETVVCGDVFSFALPFSSSFLLFMLLFIAGLLRFQSKFKH
jgi:hypothetical protein